MNTIILASASKRRLQILTDYKYNVIVKNPSVDERLIAEKYHNKPYRLVKLLSYLKAKSVYKNYDAYPVLGSDTIVYFNDKILGKPANLKEAKYNLMQMAGKIHKVITGVCIKFKKKHKLTFAYLKSRLITLTNIKLMII